MTDGIRKRRLYHLHIKKMAALIFCLSGLCGCGETKPEKLLDAFLAGEIPAIYEEGDDSVIMYDQLPHDEEDWECYSVGERIDLDNDGENEQIVNGPYGGIYFDARRVLHTDTSHAGRQLFWLTRYEGGGNIADEFGFGAEYWDSADDKYDENSDFTCRDEKITMTEYEELRKEIAGW